MCIHTILLPLAHTGDGDDSGDGSWKGTHTYTQPTEQSTSFQSPRGLIGSALPRAVGLSVGPAAVEAVGGRGERAGLRLLRHHAHQTQAGGESPSHRLLRSTSECVYVCVCCLVSVGASMLVYM